MGIMGTFDLQNKVQYQCDSKNAQTCTETRHISQEAVLWQRDRATRLSV